MISNTYVFASCNWKVTVGKLYLLDMGASMYRLYCRECGEARPLIYDLERQQESGSDSIKCGNCSGLLPVRWTPP